VPEEEYHLAAPADIREKTLAADAAHDLMLKRLNFELVQVVNCYQLQFSGNSTCHQVVILCLNFEVLTCERSKCPGLCSFKSPS
jgi:hypothetical protein